MALQETATYQVEITLSTEHGELPADKDIDQLVFDQMSGDLHFETGLTCIDVTFVKNVTTAEQESEEDLPDHRYNSAYCGKCPQGKCEMPQ